MSHSPKPAEIKVRVSAAMKKRVLQLATARGESESIIVREALFEYLCQKPLDQSDQAVAEVPTPYKTPPGELPISISPDIPPSVAAIVRKDIRRRSLAKHAKKAAS